MRAGCRRATGRSSNTQFSFCLIVRSVKKIGAGFRAALRPRLLVLVGLAAAAAAYNSIALEPLNGTQSAALFGGFLTYKAGQLVDFVQHTSKYPRASSGGCRLCINRNTERNELVPLHLIAQTPALLSSVLLECRARCGMLCARSSIPRRWKSRQRQFWPAGRSGKLPRMPRWSSSGRKCIPGSKDKLTLQ